MADHKVVKLVDPSELVLSFPMAADAVISIGDIVMVTASTGFAARAAVATGLIGVGIATEAKDNTGGAAGAIHIHVSTAPHALTLEAGTMDAGDIGAAIYAVDEDTVDGDDATGTRSQYGVLKYVDADGQLFVSPTIAGL